MGEPDFRYVKRSKFVVHREEGYRNFCRESNLDPDDSISLEMYRNELLWKKRVRLDREKKALKADDEHVYEGPAPQADGGLIREFLRKARKIDIAGPRNHPEEVAELLMEYFPKFREGGSDDLSQLDLSMEAGRLAGRFREVYSHYFKKYPDY